MLQVHVSERTWGFDSLQPHSQSPVNKPDVRLGTAGAKTSQGSTGTKQAPIVPQDGEVRPRSPISALATRLSFVRLPRLSLVRLRKSMGLTAPMKDH